MSDTESDHDCSVGEDGYCKGDKLIETRGRSLSLDDVLGLLENSDSAYNRISELTTVTIDCLTLADRSRDPASRQQAICTFQRLVTRRAFDQLLQFRLKLRMDKPITERSPFTWVDHAFAKLGALVLLIAGGSYREEDATIHGETLRGYMERDTIQAASQLPGDADSWDAFPSVLHSHHTSPAAKRLILRLLFGVLVMQSDLCGNQETNNFHEAQVVLGALETSIGEYVQFDTLTGSPITLRNGVDSALFLNLYTTLHLSQGRFSTASRNSRPYLETHLLALCDLVLHPVDISHGCTAGSVAQAICFHWGKLVPWSWMMWTDPRLANADIVTTVTMQWLKGIRCHTMCSSHRECTLAATHLSENAVVGFAALSNVLSHGVAELRKYDNSKNPLLQLLDKSCFLLSTMIYELLRNNSGSLNQLQPHITRVGSGVLHLCVIQAIGSRRERPDADIPSRDWYLELLLAIDDTLLRQCLMELQTDHPFQFSAKVDHIFSEARDILNEDQLLTPHASMIRFAFGFLTVLCTTGSRGIILRENISSLFTSFYNRLIVGSRCDENGKMLLGPMVTALIAAEKYFEPSGSFSSLTRDEFFWKLCLGEQNEAFYTSLALAQFIIHGKYPRKWLLLSETLEHFRTIILSTAKQHMPRDLEQISQLACPTFCLAMVRLLADSGDANSQAAKYFFMNSPWTTVLCAEMKRLLSRKLDSLDAGLYHDRMRHILGETGTLLLQALSDNDGPNISANAVSEMLARSQDYLAAHINRGRRLRRETVPLSITDPDDYNERASRLTSI